MATIQESPDIFPLDILKNNKTSTVVTNTIYLQAM